MMFCGYILEKSTASSNNISLFLSAHVPSPSEPEPQLGILILSNITPDSFNVSWTTRAGPFAKIVINVSDSQSLHESQQFTVSGDAQHAHVTGLVENTGYDVSVTGTTWAGDPSRPLTAFVVTGTHSKVLTCLFRILRRGKGKKVIGILKGNSIQNTLFTPYINLQVKREQRLLQRGVFHSHS